MLSFGMPSVVYSECLVLLSVVMVRGDYFVILHANKPIVAFYIIMLSEAHSKCRIFIDIMSGFMPSVIMLNSTAHIRHQSRKATALSCHRCLINTGVEVMNNISI
jgi:hypothetical protein